MTLTMAQAVADLCSVSEAAGRLRASYPQAYNLAHQGKLGDVVHISGKMFLSVAAVERYVDLEGR